MVRYVISSSESTVWIDARSSLHPVHSESAGLVGYFEGLILPEGGLDPSTEPRAHLELPIENLSSGNPLYDREMKRRVDVRRHPKIMADVVEMREVGSGHRYLVSGDITFRGTTRRVRDEVSMTDLGQGRLTFDGHHVFDIRDFGMEPPRVMMLKVYPEVAVRVHIVAEATP